MNPADHEARESSPFIERAESAGVVDDAHVMPATPVAAASVGTPTGLPVRHRGRVRGVWAGWAAGSVGVAVVVVAGHWVWSAL